MIPVLHCQCVLGEGPVWIPDEERLYFLDITGKQLHRFNPAAGTDEPVPLATLTGCFAPCSNGNLLLAAQTGIQEVRIRNHCIDVLRTLCHPEAAHTGNRYNDGKLSPDGRFFWFGSLNMNHEKCKASLYVLDLTKGGTCRQVLTGATNSNGLGWSPDGKTFYWIDTPTRQVAAFDYDTGSASLSNRRTFIRFPDDSTWGRPDGMTVDRNGNVWIAHWEGGRITQWSSSGELLQTVLLPVSKVSSVTFGGNQLFITTARSEGEPMSGDLFAIQSP